MFEQVSNGIMSIIVQAILSIVGVLVTAFVTVAIQYLNKKKEEVVNKIGVDNYNHINNVAKSTFFAVEHNFTGVSGMVDQKRKMFDSMLLHKMPHLTQQELDHFRDAIAGEINHQLKQSQLLSPTVAKAEVSTSSQPSSNINLVAPSEPIVPKETTENLADVTQSNVATTVEPANTVAAVSQ